jgi:hypothetical protein
MIKHIVCFKLKDFAEGASKAENARKIKQQLDSLAATLPGVERLEVGINIVADPMAYDIALYTEFPNQAALDAYQKHPEHQKVVQFIGKVREQRVVVDYEA